MKLLTEFFTSNNPRLTPRELRMNNASPKTIFNQIWVAILSLSASVIAFAVFFWPLPVHAQAIPVTPQQIDELASKSDRWLFIAALVVLLLFGAIVVKWLLTQLDKQREANQAATDKLISHLQNDAAASRAAIERNTQALDRNAKALEEAQSK